MNAVNVLTKHQKAKLQLMSDGKRVNWRAVSFFYTEEDTEISKFKIKWKYKASIKTIETSWDGKQLKIDDHFRKLNIMRFKENIFINLNRLQIVEERPVHGAVERTKVTFYFEDGLKLVEYLEATQWAWWKTTFL